MSINGSDSAVMMTLAAIAYKSDIRGQLLNLNYATAGDWSLVWGPMTDNYGNLAYVVKSASTGRYALTIRGSQTTFSLAALQNWFYNLDVLVQVPWMYFPDIEGCMISNGTLIQARALTMACWSGHTLAKFLTQDIPGGATLMVSGHSLGGNLATVLASWISSLRGPPAGQPDPNTVAYTFAAPSAGNKEFASAFNSRFPNSWRCWNSLDVVPDAWENLPHLDQIYDGIGIPAPSDVKIAINGMETALLASEAWYDSSYAQPNDQGSELAGHAVIPPSEWNLEAAIQHESNTYLGLLGAPLVLSELASSRTDPGPVLQRPRLKKENVAPRVAFQRLYNVFPGALTSPMSIPAPQAGLATVPAVFGGSWGGWYNPFPHAFTGGMSIPAPQAGLATVPAVFGGSWGGWYNPFPDALAGRMSIPAPQAGLATVPAVFGGSWGGWYNPFPFASAGG